MAAGSKAASALIPMDPLGARLEVLSSEADFTLELTQDGDVWSVVVTAHAALIPQSCTMVLHHAFPADEQVMLNGYQSWTDSRVRYAWSTMRGLRGVPRVLVDKFALDGSGDYRFTDYPARPGRMHGWTYATFMQGEQAVLVASLDDASGFTRIEINAAEGLVTLEKELPAEMLRAGEVRCLARFIVTQGALQDCYDAWFAAMGVAALPAQPLIGYTSWYRHYDAINQGKLLQDLDGAADVMQDVPDAASQPFMPLFQIDDGYCTVGDWLSVDAEKFPDGMVHLAQQIRARGLVPGIWVAPFVCSQESRLFQEHQDWLAQDAAGNLIKTGSHWGGAYALDTRNPEVRTYVLEVLQTITQEWGFELIKADFLYAACMEPHDGLNRGQLMADAIDLLRLGAGSQNAILACGVPLASVFGKVEYCRIGCDVSATWDDKPYMRLLHRERVSTKNSLDNTIARRHLNGRAFTNDPDVVFLGDDVALTADQKELLLATDVSCAGVLITSDDMGAWTQAQRQRFIDAAQEIMLYHKAPDQGTENDR